MVSRARGTPYFPYAMYVALPLIIHPIFFIFVFGSLKGTLTLFLIGGGALRLLRNSFELWSRSRARVTPAENSGDQIGLSPNARSR